MIRAVFDTNIFVSSLLVKSGKPARALQAWRERQILLITSPALIAEIVQTLSYPRIRRKYAVSGADITELIDLLRHDALNVPGEADVAGAIPEDPDDEPVLACALDGAAEFIVSGDQHLLDLGVFQGIPIITVSELLERLERGSD